MALLNRYGPHNLDGERRFKPQIIASHSVLINLWDHSLKGGLCGAPGRYALLQDYFFVLALQPGAEGRDRFQILKRYEFEPVPTDHVQIERKYDWPSFGVYITDRRTGESVFFTGDTKFDYPAYARYMHDAKLIFHDVQLAPAADAVHALLAELRTMPPEVKRKTVLFHYGDDWDTEKYGFVAEEFAGFAQPQVRYTLFA